MSDIDYPPSSTLRLGDELDRLRPDDDGEDVNETHIEGLEWAVREWGGDATVRIQGMTTARRDRCVDTANRTTIGPLGASALRTWILSASIVDAPWLDGDEDLQAQHNLTAAFPPAFTDWLDSQVEDINDLSEGN